MLLHKNFPFSAGKVIKHKNYIYFFVVDQIKKKELRTECFPSDEMISDCRSKLTQGSFFVCQRNEIQSAKNEGFPRHNDWHEKVLMKYDLWDESDFDLDSI